MLLLVLKIIGLVIFVTLLAAALGAIWQGLDC